MNEDNKLSASESVSTTERLHFHCYFCNIFAFYGSSGRIASERQSVRNRDCPLVESIGTPYHPARCVPTLQPGRAL